MYNHNIKIVIIDSISNIYSVSLRIFKKIFILKDII